MNPTPYQSKPELQNSRAIPGALFSFLASGNETNGEFALLKIEVLKGNEPPGHSHTRESESYFILEGTINFTIGETEVTANLGDFVFLPKNVWHQFKLHSEKAEVLMWVSPAGLEDWFWKNSDPVTEMKPLPLPVGPPPPEVIEHMKSSLNQFGVEM